MNEITQEVFEAGQEFPDPDSQRRLAALVGLDSHRERLSKALRLILDPEAILEWSKRHHKRRLGAIDHFSHRPPLFLLAGDVGTGKTALAETIGDDVARAEIRDLCAWRPVAMDAELLESGWKIQDRHHLSFWDSLIVAAAKSSSCRYLLTEDLQPGQDLDGIVVVNPFLTDPTALLPS